MSQNNGVERMDTSSSSGSSSGPGPAGAGAGQLRIGGATSQQHSAGASGFSTPNHSNVNNEPYSPDPCGFALSDLIMQLEDYPPTIPDAVANHFLQGAGFESTDPRISRLISLCAQKFVSDIVNDAFTHCKLKGIPQPGGKAKVKDRKYILSLEDLVPVLNDYGITVKKPPYYV